MQRARMGSWIVTNQDFVVCDADGVLLLPESSLRAVVDVAMEIRQTERGQAGSMNAGVSFREQTRFSEYLAMRARTPDLTPREYLKKARGVIET